MLVRSQQTNATPLGRKRVDAYVRGNIITDKVSQAIADGTAFQAAGQLVPEPAVSRCERLAETLGGEQLHPWRRPMQRSQC
jgi:hypothetical protein